ncbi:hypothetical protein [Brevibacterium litoralis]|uniref:hypothetical protein n=1 Tax=Brevibacterium litoralis TaxID=3138935 RepID=UPI0032EDA0ED
MSTDADETVRNNQLSNDFIDVCSLMESHLESKYKLETEGLGDSIRQVRDRDSVVARNRAAFEVIGRARNLLSHRSRVPGIPTTVTPSPQLLGAANNLLKQLTEPPTAADYANEPLDNVVRADALAPVMKKMTEDDFSQVLVVDPGHEVVLLTTNTIARWAASWLDDDGTLVAEAATVADALASKEDNEKVVAVKPTTSVLDIIEAFESSRPPRAVVVTKSGSLNDKPTGILVVDDVPAMHRGLQFLE